MTDRHYAAGRDSDVRHSSVRGRRASNSSKGSKGSKQGAYYEGEQYKDSRYGQLPGVNSDDYNAFSSGQEIKSERGKNTSPLCFMRGMPPSKEKTAQMPASRHSDGV